MTKGGLETKGRRIILKVPLGLLSQYLKKITKFHEGIAPWILEQSMANR